MSVETLKAMREWPGLVWAVEVDEAPRAVVGPLRVPVVPVGAPVVLGRRGRK